MSFPKITDPKKRDFVVNESLKTRKNIPQNFLSERVGESSAQHELSKLFKSVAYMQKDLKDGLASELKPIREGMENLPKAITFPQYLSITAFDDDDDSEQEEDVFIGDIAEQYLRIFATVSGVDKTFGVRDKDGRFYIGNKEAKIKDNNIIVDDKTPAYPDCGNLLLQDLRMIKFSPMGIMIIMLK